MDKLLDKFRMVVWLLVGMALYAAVPLIGTDHPTYQTVATKLGNVATFSWLGYWIARMALGRLDMLYKATDGQLLARSVVVGCAIIAGALGL